MLATCRNVTAELKPNTSHIPIFRPKAPEILRLLKYPAPLSVTIPAIGTERAGEERLPRRRPRGSPSRPHSERPPSLSLSLSRAKRQTVLPSALLAARRAPPRPAPRTPAAGGGGGAGNPAPRRRRSGARARRRPRFDPICRRRRADRISLPPSAPRPSDLQACLTTAYHSALV